MYCLNARSEFCVILVLPVGVAENIERGGIARIELGGFLVMFDGIGKILLAEIVTSQREPGAFIVWVLRDQLVQVFLLLRHIAVGAPASAARIWRRSPAEAFSDNFTALFRCSKNSLAVGLEVARFNSAMAKLESNAIALS